MTEAKYKKLLSEQIAFGEWRMYIYKLTEVVKTTVGYLGGEYKNPSYKDVCVQEEPVMQKLLKLLSTQK
jgi:peptide methionine sulfoxide reductase MsrA